MSVNYTMNDHDTPPLGVPVVKQPVQVLPVKEVSIMRKFPLFMLAMILLIPVVRMLAQESDQCSPEAITQRVGAVYETYNGNGAQSDIEGALNSIDMLNAEIDAIYSECDEARFQAYVAEGAALLEDLRAGGFVLYVRHARTDQSQEDTDLASCETQRNLSAEGRADAVRIGEAWATLGISVDVIMSTEYCRTRETAQLAFGEPEIVPRAEFEETLDDWLATVPADGMNTIIVGHVDLLEEVTGIQIPEDVRLNEGDALVYRPLGGAMGSGGYELVTRISFRNWFDLARIAADMETE
jgi:phosphohistidine phosphatase SixA